MIEKTFSKTYTSVSKQQIWQLWANIDQWPRWNPGVDACKLHGPFTAGSHFTLTPKNGPEVDIELEIFKSPTSLHLCQVLCC